MIPLAIVAAFCIIGGTVTILAAWGNDTQNDDQMELEPYPAESVKGFLAGVILIALGGGIVIAMRMSL